MPSRLCIVFTFHVSRFTFHVPRFTFHLPRLAIVLLALTCLCGCGPSPESRRLLSQLRSPNPAARLQGIQQAEIKAEECVRKELLRIFSDERELPIVRSCAGMALAHLQDRRIIAPAIQRLPSAICGISHPGPGTRLNAYLLGRILAASGPDALPPLSALLRDPHKEVVAWTIMQHGLYRHNDQALAVLGRYLDDRDVILRRSASFGLVPLSHPRTQELALRRLADPDPEVRFNLAWALRMSGSSQAVGPLEAQLAKEKNPEVKAELAKALAAAKARPVAKPDPIVSKSK
jgi:HEAT repeat protein